MPSAGFDDGTSAVAMKASVMTQASRHWARSFLGRSRGQLSYTARFKRAR